MKKQITLKQKKIYERIIEEATMDCYEEYEQISGWVCLLGDKIGTPCKCKVAKQDAVLEKIDTDDNDSCVVGVIRFGKSKLRVLFQYISFEPPGDMNYANAYNYWCKNG